VIRAFSPVDALRLRSRQAQGISLDLEASVLVGGSALRRALEGWWPGRGSPYCSWLLEPLDESVPAGFLQARQRRGGAEADLIFVAPALHGSPRAALSWQRLLTETAREMAGQGILRLHVAIDQEDSIAAQLLRRLGFVDTAQDTVYHRLEARAAEALAAPRIRSAPPQPAHQAALDRLSLVCLAQTAGSDPAPEGGEWARYPLGGHFSGPQDSRVWLDGHGAVLGAWRRHDGPAVSWIDCISAPGTDAVRLLADALANLDSTRQAYAVASSAQADLHGALRQQGFEAFAHRLHFVKHSALRVIEPAWRDQTSRDTLMEPAANPSNMNRSITRQD
jgi:hypothetical protein